MDEIHSQLQSIHDRNRRVEIDKAWEISLTRRAFIAVITYVTAAAFLWTADVGSPFTGALVPTGGYVLSTLSLPWVKAWWMKHARQ